MSRKVSLLLILPVKKRIEKKLVSEFFALFFSLSSHVDQLFPLSPLSSLSVSFHDLSVVQTSKRDEKAVHSFLLPTKVFYTWCHHCLLSFSSQMLEVQG